MSVYMRWWRWLRRHRLGGERYLRLYVRLARSPATRRAWADRH